MLGFGLGRWGGALTRSLCSPLPIGAAPAAAGTGLPEGTQPKDRNPAATCRDVGLLRGHQFSREEPA